MFVFYVDHLLAQQYANITRSVLLLIITLAFLSGCNSSRSSRFLYPSEKELEVRYLCRLPYLDETAPHQPWAESTPVLLIVGQDKVIVYFSNYRSFALNKNTNVSLPPGKYRCTL
ncbi:MAG: hypothetical protein MAG581_00901 [Deltaproteobacteria bacterium]|jgi:hypothetical protein|nr:hypothetical protein [Deltaproteobacteria bacterium]